MMMARETPTHVALTRLFCTNLEWREKNTKRPLLSKPIKKTAWALVEGVIAKGTPMAEGLTNGPDQGRLCRSAERFRDGGMSGERAGPGGQEPGCVVGQTTG